MKNNVKAERTKLGLTQQELGDKVNVSRQTIISIETGRYQPTVSLAIKISKVLKSKVEDLFIVEPMD